MAENELNEYFIKIKGTPIKSAGRTEASAHQEVIEAINARVAMHDLSKRFDIQELVAINKL